jgi:hypothetical protein
MNTKFQLEKLEGRDCLGDLIVDGITTLKVANTELVGEYVDAVELNQDMLYCKILMHLIMNFKIP